MELPAGVELRGPIHPRYEEVLSPAALEFLAGLHREFEPVRRRLLSARVRRQAELDAGGRLGFLPEAVSVREDPHWRVPEPAPGLTDRRVEITGPPARQVADSALNSGANVWLADFEDANVPLWENLVGGQLTLVDALSADSELATIVVRPRGWHLPEKHLVVDGAPVSGSLFDFGLYVFHCADRQLARGAGPYFYLPKLEHHREARLWNEVFVRAQDWLDLPRGTIRATVLIETVQAAFQMEEIVYELREHCAGLNAGRWDYLFSMIKTCRTRGDDCVLPQRSALTMTLPFMRAYTELLVRTCHRRGAHAIGGVAAFVPGRRDREANERALAMVRRDKQREAADGFDGSSVAHPDLVPVCREAFDEVLDDRPDQRHRLREEVAVSAADLLDLASVPGEITEAGLRDNLAVGLRYLAAWLSGTGAVTISHLMEDVATAEICRSQVWQWVHLGVPLADGRTVTRSMVDRLIERELAEISDELGDAFDAVAYARAAALLREVTLSAGYVDFLTLPGYELLP